MSLTRRDLVRGGLAAGLLARISGIQKSFADEARAILPAGSATVDRSAYSLDPDVVYLNHASIGTIPRAVQHAHEGYLRLCEENPWLYMWGGAWEAPREAVRTRAATLLGARATDIAFTHNTTETFNLLAQGLPLGVGDEVLFPSLNHPGASVCFEQQATRRGFSVRRFDLPVDAVSDPETLLEGYAGALSKATKLLVLPHVDNVLGLRQPVARIAAQARDRGVRWTAVDAAQTVGMLPVDVGDLDVDIYATSPHKWLQAPKGLGLTYISQPARSELEPMWTTWGQRRWADSARRFEDYGTRNLAAVLAFGDAIDFHRRIDDRARIAHHRSLREHARARVEAAPRLTWPSAPRFANGAALYTVGFEGPKATDVARTLFTEHGIVLRPFVTDEINGLRVSPNLANGTEDLDRLFDALEGLLEA